MIRIGIVAPRTWLIAAVTICEAVASGQSKFSVAFDQFKITRDRPMLDKELANLVDHDCDLRMEIPALLEMISDSSNPEITDLARGMVYVLAIRRRTDGDLFRRAIPIFESHLPANADNNRKETDPWEGSIVMLEAIFGFPPSPRVLALMYKMVDYKYDPWAQGLAFEALAKLQPIPLQAKELFSSRMVKTEGKVSGADLLPHLAPGLSDSDVLQMFLISAESRDVQVQRRSTRELANMNEIPPQAAEVFRRLQVRGDLDESVATNVHGAINRIDHVAPRP